MDSFFKWLTGASGTLLFVVLAVVGIICYTILEMTALLSTGHTVSF